MKVLYRLSLVVLAITIVGIARIQVGAQQVVPDSAEVKIDLADFPDSKNIKSKWDVTFQLRITTEAEWHAAQRAGKVKMDEAERVGDLVHEEIFSRESLSLPQNRSISIKIPFKEEIQNRLRSEPRTRVDLTKEKIDENDKEKSREEEAKAQIFLFYVKAVVFNGKTRKTTIVPLNRVMSFRQYGSADFIYTITLTKEGYNVAGPVPK